ncbi:uncharacterized protein BDV14DRAFT_202268 [Aspergillus stella-maris]|uniref:uncharacterized protein n=1 Tax=Aspergillus stella-maris TaxID=1810926 RepID=UPI003CCC976E
MTDPMYCYTCEAPAREICYRIHVFDPDHRSSSHDLAEELFMSAFELLPTSVIPWQADLDASFLDLKINFLDSDGPAPGTEFDPSLHRDIDELLAEGHPNFPPDGQFLSRQTTMPVEWNEVAAPPAPRPPPIRAGLPSDFKPSDAQYLSRCRRSASNPNLGEESQRRYVEELSRLQGRVVRALQVIEVEKDKLRLTRSRSTEWASLLQRGRDLAVSQAFNIAPGYRFPLLDVLKRWVVKVENLAVRMELDVRKIRQRYQLH